jgi:hypothetical protein
MTDKILESAMREQVRSRVLSAFEGLAHAYNQNYDAANRCLKPFRRFKEEEDASVRDKLSLLIPEQKPDSFLIAEQKSVSLSEYASIVREIASNLPEDLRELSRQTIEVYAKQLAAIIHLTNFEV